MNIATEIRRRFEASAWSIKRLAETAAVPYSAVHAFVKSGADIRVSTASKLAVALGLRLVADKPKGR